MNTHTVEKTTALFFKLEVEVNLDKNVIFGWRIRLFVYYREIKIQTK